MKKILFLSFLCCIKLSFALPISNDSTLPILNKLDTTKISSTVNNNDSSLKYKYIAACAAALGANFFLEYISTYAHEKAHVITCGGSCTIKMELTKDPLIPWGAIISTPIDATKEISVFSILAGPLVGISTTYLQGVALKAIDEYITHKKPLKESFSEGLKFPITFFSDAVKVGKRSCSDIINQQSNDSTEQPTISSLALNGLLILRTGRIIGETLSGLLPCKNTDGRRIWKKIFGPQTPKLPFSVIPAATLTILSTPYVVGTAQAIYEKYTKI